MMKRILISETAILCLVIAGSSCGPNQRILESSNENQGATVETGGVNSNVVSAASTFEADLNSMRTADFKFILVFRRKDGQPLDAADKDLIRNTGFKENRRRLSDEGKAVIIGSNFPFLEGAFDKLAGRFSMENYSKPDSGPMYSNSFMNE